MVCSATPRCCGAVAFFERGWRSLVDGRIKCSRLIALGTGVRLRTISLGSGAMPGIFPPSFRTQEGEVRYNFEPADRS